MEEEGYSSRKEEEEHRRERKIRRLEKKLERERKKRRYSSSSRRPRNRSRRRSTSRPSERSTPANLRSRYYRSSTRSRSRYSRRYTRSPSNSFERSPSNHESVRIPTVPRDIQGAATENNHDDEVPTNNVNLTVPIVPEENFGVTPQVALATEAPQVTSASIPEHEVELQPEVLEVIGARLETDKKCTPAVHKDIAIRWAEILKNGLPTEEIQKLLKKHPPPENCPFIAVPKLNAEIIAAVQETAIKRDTRIVEKQERVGACLSAVGRAFSIALKIEGTQKIELLEYLSEGGRLLASVHREESLARKSLVLANLNSSLKTTLSNTTVDEWLFSADLEGLIKSAKTLERTSKDLKTPSKPSQQKKNWKGPTRQTPFKNRSTTSGGYRRRPANHSDSKKPSYRKENHHYKKRG